MRLFLPVLLVGSLCATSAWGQQPIGPACLSNENLRHYRSAGSLALSPDGRRVAFTIREATADHADTHIWWAVTDTPNSARQVTFAASADQGSETSPQWLPDGSAMLFLARRDKHRQIYRLPVAGGEAAPINISWPAAGAERSDTSSRNADSDSDRLVDVGSYEVSPDGRWIALSASGPQSAAERRRRADKNDANVVNQETNPPRVWLYSMTDGSLVPLTDTTRSTGSFAWSHDSRRLAIVTEGLGNVDDLGPEAQLEVVDINNPASRRRVEGAPPTVSRVSWSPNDADFAFTAQTTHDAPPGVSDLYILPVAGGVARNVTASSGVEVGSVAAWASDGHAVFGSVQQGTTSRLARIDLANGTAEILETGAPVAGSFVTNSKNSGWAFVASASNRTPEVEYSSNFSAGGDLVRLAAANPAWPDSGWAQAQQVQWKSRDGLTIHGLFFMPPSVACNGTPRSTRVPLIINVHGGPTGAFTESFSPFVQWELAQGWAVLQPNPRGSTGYGWAFAAANKNDLGGKDYEDVMTGLDWALAHAPIDSTRVGLYGYSYGGEMAGFVEGRTTRFAAIVSGAPVIDQYSEYGTENGSWYDRWFFGQPWRRSADAWRQSPLARVSDARTPFLLLQGQADQTDPLGQSEEMYRALRQEGVEVRLVTYPRESHGGLGGAIAGSPSPEPWHGFDARQQILDWFTAHFHQK